MKKKLLSLFLSLVLLISLSAGLTAQAAEYEPQFTKAADILYTLGLFKGTGTNEDGTPIYALDRQATRIEGLVMLIRLLGEEDEALAFTGTCPFTDVPTWAEKYAGYAYEKGYTKGTSATTFSDGPLYSNAFLTFVLRALGYNDAAGDFTYNNACWKAAELGIVGGGEYLDQTKAIYRDSCAQIAFNALVTPKKGTEKFLVDHLVTSGTVTRAALKESGLNSTDNMYSPNLDLGMQDAAEWSREMNQRIQAIPAKDKQFYGLDENISWVAYPTTEAEFLNNIYCSLLLGDYTINCTHIYDFQTALRLNAVTNTESLFELGANKPEMFGAYANSEVRNGFWYEDVNKTGFFRSTMDIDFFEASLTRDQISRHAEQAKKAAYEISNKLHRSGTIKAGMTETEIAQVYYDYLSGMGVQAVDVETRADCMKYDTTYACLVQKKANCLGRAAAFNVLLHIEGISSQGLLCHFHGVEEGDDHILNYVILDGQEYVCDWFNNVPIQTIEEAESQLEFYEYSLNLARTNA